MAFALRTLALRALLVPALLLGGAAGAHAASIVVDYDLYGSTLSIESPLPTEVGQDAIAGSMQIRFETDGLGNILLDGASSVTLESLLLDVSLNMASGGVAGPVAIELLGPVAGGMLGSDGVISFAGSPDASLGLTGTLNCSLGFLCGVAGLDAGANPVDEVLTQPLGDLAFGLPFDPAALHELTAVMDVDAPVGDVQLESSLSLVATETGRTFFPDPVSVPEPGTMLLLGSGLVGLVVFGRQPRREGTSIRQG